MSKILISEDQFKRLVKKVLLYEAELGAYETVSGGTNKSPVSHKYLTQYGLPFGNYEGFNFKTTFDAIFKASKGPQSSFLASFKPNQNMGGYLDYISIGGSVYNAGDPKAKDANGNDTYKAGTFVSGPINEADEVVASHNGLLAITRIMLNLSGMQKMPRTVSVIFGGDFEDANAQKAAEQRTKAATLVSIPDSAYNITPELLAIAQLLVCYLDIANKSQFCKTYLQNANSYTVLTTFINKVISGFKFLPKDQETQYAENLSKVNFLKQVDIPDIKTVLTDVINGRKNMSTNPQTLNYETTKVHNNMVLNQILNLIDERIRRIQQLVIKYYVDNLKIYVSTYFRGDSDEEMAKINALKANIIGAKTAYDYLFKEVVQKQTIQQGSTEQTSDLLPKLGN
jgi:hypothetical protein